MTPLYQSATLKLTLWYLCLVMVISLSFSAVIFKVGRDELAEGLHNQSARIYQTYPVFSSDPFFQKSTDVDAGSRHILTNLLYANLAVLVLAGFASYWLAKRTLEPIVLSSEQQKRFVADASHELRTPLTAIKMESEVTLLDHGASKDMLRSSLRSNLEEAEKLSLLLESLLRLSRLDASVGPPLQPADLAPLIDAAIKAVMLQAKAKEIHITTKVAPRSRAMVDSTSFIQLLVILLDNALKYSPAKSRVTISTLSDGDSTVVSVEDQGVGIPPEALAHVFDRFYRADVARTSNNGYGLGLSIAKQIADVHQAQLTLTSAVGQGTRALVTLPAIKPNT